jgi:hypothetical protein
MTRKLAALVALVASVGCRMCSDSCDYSSPVADGPYAGTYGRAGSAFTGMVLDAPAADAEAVAAPAVDSISQPPAVMTPAPALEPRPESTP